MTPSVIIEVPITLSPTSQTFVDITNYTQKCILYIGLSMYFILCNIGMAANHHIYFMFFENIFKISKLISVLIISIHLCSVKISKFIGFVWIFTVSIVCLIYFIIHGIFIIDFIKDNDPRTVYLIWEYINNIHYYTLVFTFYIFNINDTQEPNFKDEIKTIFCIEVVLFNLIKYIIQTILSFIKNYVILPSIHGFGIICQYIRCKSNIPCNCNLFCNCGCIINNTIIDNVNETSNQTCSICLDEITNPINPTKIIKAKKEKKLNCNHSFHTDCINTWLSNHNNCPLCRRPSV